MKTTSAKKILSPAQAEKWVKTQQRKKKKVVFTNGCFDLIHSGHITYLEEAKRQGDFLLVALNGDASVRKLKGKERPLNALKDRLKVMAALGCVDAVTWFHQETPKAIIHKLLPKVLVKGGDWKIDTIVGAADVLAHGGIVKSLSFVEGKSTTKIIAKARSHK